MKTLCLWLYVISVLLHFQTGVSLHNHNTSLCRQDQMQLLLQLNQNLYPHRQSRYFTNFCDLPENYYRTKYWNESRDCCDWDGVTCDDSTGSVIGLDLSCGDSTGSVIGLDLSCGGLTGIIHSNSSLFRLTRLQNLNLAFNYFSGSQISPKISWLSSLTHLNLSHSNFSGPIPLELYHLSNLISLDIWTRSSPLAPNNVYCDLKLLVQNMTKIEALVLTGTNISSEIPTNMSSFLTHLDLRWTGLHGNLGINLLERPKLQVLRLGGNRGLKGSLPNSFNGSNVHSFRELDISLTNISGRLPESIGLFNNLVHMDLSQTSISGRLPESIGLLNKLVYMDISECNFWGPIPESIGNITAIESFYMISNQLSGQIPNAFANLQNLGILSLRNNSFVGEIPSSLSNMSQLGSLDISSNLLTGSFPSGAANLPPFLFLLDLSHNSLQRMYMKNQWWQYLQNLEYLYLQSNEFEGAFPSSLCNLTSLRYLVLSDNKFRGKLPQCIGNASDTLQILDLSRNEFSGTFPTTLGIRSGLIILEVSDNNMEGPLPQSLANCTALQVLDFGKNMINDTFPWWLQTLPQLRILILKSNTFHGSISPPAAGDSFSELRIVDLSHDYFTGLLPDHLFAALKNPSANHNIPLVDFYNFDYLYSVILSLKGDDREFTSVRDIVTTIDLSTNNFHGSIPESLADLTSLWLLNLSHNTISGSIPPAFGHLTTLEQLDLSCNRLTGGIPYTLTNLTYLSFLNLSYNHLAGPIPEGAQFRTFSSDSYIGNLGLYENGKEHPSPRVVIQEEKDDGCNLIMTGFSWQAVAIGYGCGIVIGFILGSMMLSIGKPRWFARLYYAEEANCLNLWFNAEK